MKSFGRLISRRRLSPIRALPEGAEHRHVFVDVRGWAGDAEALPLRYGSLRLAHHWGKPVALEIECANPIYAHEQARLLTALGLRATVVTSEEHGHRLLRAILSQQRKADQARGLRVV